MLYRHEQLGRQLSYKGGLFGGEAGPWMRMFRNAYAFATQAKA